MKPHDLIHNGLYMVADTVVRYNALNGHLYYLCGAFFGEIYADAGKDCEIMCRRSVGWFDINPLSLTAEILEKNGWITDQFYSEYTNNNDVQIQWDCGNCRGRSHTWEFSYSDIDYVHQLQHILCLHGQHSLAYHFIV